MPIQKGRLIQTKQLYQGKIVAVRVDTIAMVKAGVTVEATREIVEHSPSVVMVPLDEANNLLLVEQYRHSTGEVLLEVPAGGIEEGESPQDAAVRELREETGHTSGRITPIGEFWIAPGWSTEYMYAYLMQDLLAAPLPQDADEQVEVVPVPVEEVPELIRQGRIRDAKSIAAFLMALNLPPPEKRGGSYGTKQPSL